MENKYVIGILNIVEDKLREFGIEIPDDHREDSKDPIVGYQYAELHDRIQEYLEENGLLHPQDHQEMKTKIHAVSIVNSQGWMNGNESTVNLYPSLHECMDQSYQQYLSIMEELAEEGQLEAEDLEPMSFEAYRGIMLGDRCLNIQLSDFHILIEYYEKDLTLNNSLCGPYKEHATFDDILSFAESRVVPPSHNEHAKRTMTSYEHA